MIEFETVLKVMIKKITFEHGSCREYMELLEKERRLEIVFPTIEDATKVQKAICMYLSRNRIFDVRQKRRGNVIFLMKGEFED